ncbi:type I glyceraldehyde-3-phosphate dehydrogenase [Patescibacteria group bacterium]|nr:type I glyceraldehyde-3-phosphate dehydrogenase [Patescibacteria group bacterium]
MPSLKKSVTKIAINGFGRIGRAAFKIALTKPNLKVVAINDLMAPEILAHLLKYDTVYGVFNKEVSYDNKHLIVDGIKYLVTAEKEPDKLPWQKLEVQAVLECTGRFTKKQDASLHLKAGAQKVVLSAPAKGGEVPTVILGVSDVDKLQDKIISNASCTTNCITPIAQVMQENFRIHKAMMTTIHSYTAEQNLVDGPPPARHNDMRRARAAAQNIVPTSTGAALATAEVIPKLKGVFDGLAVRVPTICVSLSDFTFLVREKNLTVAKINAAFKKAARSKQYRGVLEVTDQPLVSSDFIGNPASVIVDLSLTQVVDGNMVKVIGWYDNEWGYSNRLVELAEKIS